MDAKRKDTWTGIRLAISIPSQIAQLHDVNEGDFLEFTPNGHW